MGANTARQVGVNTQVKTLRCLHLVQWIGDNREQICPLDQTFTETLPVKNRLPGVEVKLYIHTAMLLVDVKFLWRDGEPRPQDEIAVAKPFRRLLRVSRIGSAKPYALLQEIDPRWGGFGQPQMLLKPAWLLDLEGDVLRIGGYESQHGNWSHPQRQMWECRIVRDLPDAASAETSIAMPPSVERHVPVSATSGGGD